MRHMATDRFVSLSEVKHLLNKEGKQRELSAEQKVALDHAQKFSSLDYESTRKLHKELAGLGFVSEQNMVKITDLLPVTPEDVRLVFSKERLTPEKKQIEQITEIILKFV